METLDSYYVISAINTKTKKREYVANDTHSGGWPYWNGFYNSVDVSKHKEIPSVCWKKDDSIHNDHPVLEIIRIDVYIAESWSVKESAQAKLQEKKKKLQQEMASLQKELDALGDA